MNQETKEVANELQHPEVGQVKIGNTSKALTGIVNGNGQIPVSFNPPFSSTPVVMIALSLINADSDHNIRAKAEALAVTPYGFTANVYSWSSTVMYELGASWIAIGN